jgi:hypothetical protein
VSTVGFAYCLSEPTSARDLGSIELWDRSLARSRQRRRLHDLNRRSRRRRKTASLAVSAAMAGGQVLPQAIAAATSGRGPSTGAASDARVNRLAQTDSSRAVLVPGSHGGLVAAAQRRLNEVLPLSQLAVDGIFGPLTHTAVLDFQRRHGLVPTGAIDVGTWAHMFNAPVLVFGSAGQSAQAPTYVTRRSTARQVRATTGTHRIAADRRQSFDGPVQTGQPSGSGAGAIGTGLGGGGSHTLIGGPGTVPVSQTSGGAAPAIAVVAPSAPTSQPSTYVLSNGVALPLPRQYITGAFVDQGVDYSAPGGTPEYAMGDGVIIGEGISGFGPNAPILQITSGPLKGLEVYYGHSGSDLVRVGQHVSAGQQITEVGYGIVGISTGPHLEVGFYPTGSVGSGGRMLALLNGLLRAHPSGRSWGTGGAVAHAVRASADRNRSARKGSSSGAPTQPAPSSTGSQPTAAGGGGQTAGSGSTPQATSSTSPTPAPTASNGSAGSSTPTSAPQASSNAGSQAASTVPAQPVASAPTAAPTSSATPPPAPSLPADASAAAVAVPQAGPAQTAQPAAPAAAPAAGPLPTTQPVQADPTATSPAGPGSAVSVAAGQPPATPPSGNGGNASVASDPSAAPQAVPVTPAAASTSAPSGTP